MFRTPEGGRKFSFTRFINNAVPNLALGPQTYDLDAGEQDFLFEYQLGEPDPLKLGEESFTFGGITQSKAVSAQIHRALIKNGVLKTGDGDGEQVRIDTKAITAQFSHQLAFISAHAQKKLINLLFFWEEEIMRWNVLIGEKQELETVISETRQAGADQIGGLEKRLKELQGLLRVKPSLRGEEARKKESLPGYAESAGAPAR
ncbi:hypothetical protein BCR34DRAFT_573074 [Clohesyomyces aquaticus]|uniref:Uncharacterized protein n=1 Tax=Clohesyomyces aquaticus TaxID=1231657 RepID=A0A1Y1Z131_9PLEO|nr:hypothetical protein BCR34DRAFT_573074 [Clohesyomyces aquaticus]